MLHEFIMIYMIYKISGYSCIVFIDFMLKGKSFSDYTNLFYPNKYEKNHKMILKYFQ